MKIPQSQVMTILSIYYCHDDDIDDNDNDGRITSSWWTSSAAGTAGWAGGLTQTRRAALTSR